MWKCFGIILWALRNVFVGVKSQEQRMKKYVTRPSISYTNSSTTPEEDEVVMVEQASQSNAEEDKTIGRHGRLGSDSGKVKVFALGPAWDLGILAT